MPGDSKDGNICDGMRNPSDPNASVLDVNPREYDASNEHAEGSECVTKWIDEEGNVVYQDTPPPSSVNFEEQVYEEAGGFEAEVADAITAAADANPISFYSISNCEACDLVRLYLENLSLPFSEKDIADNTTVQQELKALTGQLRVPTLAIGSEIIDGYSKQGIRRLLLDAGYPLEEIEGGALPGSSPVAQSGEQQSGQPDSTEQAAADSGEAEIVDPEDFNYDLSEEGSEEGGAVVEIERENDAQ